MSAPTELSGEPMSFNSSTLFMRTIPGFRFLKAKVTILQQELELSHKENVKHSDQLAKVGEQQKKIEAACDQSSNKVNNMKTQIEKLHQQNAETELKSKVCRN